KTCGVAFLLRQQRPPVLRHVRLVPAIDRPLGRLGAVVVLECLALQSVARIARQISGCWLFWHVVSPMWREDEPYHEVVPPGRPARFAPRLSAGCILLPMQLRCGHAELAGTRRAGSRF